MAIFTNFNCIWTQCGLCKILGHVAMCLGQVVSWVELLVQRRLCPIFIVVSGYPTSTNISRVDGLSTDSLEMGRHTSS